jgi:hypothetical protein
MTIPILVGPGFVVEDMGLATRGRLTPTTVFEVGDPLPPSEAGATDLLGRFYGVDLRMTTDYLVMGSGDLQRTEGLEALKASFARALVTVPGGIFWRPDWGIGITDFLNRRASAADIHEMKNRIRTTLASDPAVDEVSAPEVVVNADGMIEVNVDVKIAGQVQPIALGIRGD